MDTKNIGFQKQVVKFRAVPRPVDPGAEIYRLTLHVSRLDAEVSALRAEVVRLREANTAAIPFAFSSDKRARVDSPNGALIDSAD